MRYITSFLRAKAATDFSAS